MDSSHPVNPNSVSSSQPSASGLPDLGRCSTLAAEAPSVQQALGASARGSESPASEADQVFNVCHVGVVLRAVLLVNGALAIGVMFGTKAPMEWVLQTAFVTSVALPCLLLWLTLACVLRRRLAAMSAYWQWMAAGSLGAVSAGLGWWGGQMSQLPVLADQPPLASMFAGAGLGVALTGWLQMRAESLGPAHTAARLVQLQARIRPHFLFNTINTALCLVRADPPRAEQVLEDLAELFRHALADMRESVTLAEEVELAERYLAIEKIRFGDRLRLNWQLDPAASLAKLPPLLLQPLVENAVRHGVEPCPEGGVVHIQTAVRLGLAVITITNSVGAASTPGHGIALHNVRERLYLMHDVAARFEAQREDHQYRVRMEVPL